MFEEVRVPADRLGILMGRGGETIKRLRGATKTRISAKDEIIAIEGEALNVLEAKNVINAIIRGFSPDKAFLLLEGYLFKDVDLKDLVPENRIEAVKSRVIGKGGRTREILEEFTSSYLSVSDHDIAVISAEDDLPVILEALEMFISGISHRTVYAFLERKRREKSD